MLDAPHVAWPVRFETQPDGSVQLATVEQNTPGDYATQVATIVSCRIGYRDELPEFGVTALAFQQGDLQTGLLRTQIQRWLPPGVDLDARETVDAINQALRTLRVAAVPDTP